MQITTSRFGAIEIDEGKILTFPHGIPGFVEREYSIVVVEHHLPFLWLQSVANPALAFVIADPFLFFPDYRPVVGEADKQLLGIRGNDTALYCITVVKEGPHVTMNLLAPLVINARTNIGKQVVLEGTSYTVRHQVPLAALQAKVSSA